MAINPCAIGQQKITVLGEIPTCPVFFVDVGVAPDSGVRFFAMLLIRTCKCAEQAPSFGNHVITARGTNRSFRPAFWIFDGPLPAGVPASSTWGFGICAAVPTVTEWHSRSFGNPAFARGGFGNG